MRARGEESGSISLKDFQPPCGESELCEAIRPRERDDFFFVEPELPIYDIQEGKVVTTAMSRVNWAPAEKLDYRK